MTQAQEQHLLDIKQHFSAAVDKKYRKGQNEHGGNLWDRNTLDDIGDEAVDLVTYIYVAKERDNKLRLAVHNWRSGHITNEQAKKQIGDILGF